MTLSRLTVLDFCWVGAGAFVTRILADLGADVIKVELRSHPDNLPLSGPHRTGAKPLEFLRLLRVPQYRQAQLRAEYVASEGARDRAATGPALLDHEQQFSARRDGEVGSRLRRGVGRQQVDHLFVDADARRRGSASRLHRLRFDVAALCGLVNMAGLPGRPPLGTGTIIPAIAESGVTRWSRSSRPSITANEPATVSISSLRKSNRPSICSGRAFSHGRQPESCRGLTAIGDPVTSRAGSIPAAAMIRGARLRSPAMNNGAISLKFWAALLGWRTMRFERGCARGQLRSHRASVRSGDDAVFRRRSCRARKASRLVPW